jgi:hypothetical protein
VEAVGRQKKESLFQTNENIISYDLFVSLHCRNPLSISTLKAQRWCLVSPPSRDATTTNTEFTSNAATASIMIPVLGSAAEGIGVNPLAVLLPGTYATGMAFMLPIATPPNAIVYATKKLQFTSMVGGGFILNIISSLVILLFTATVGINLFWWRQLDARRRRVCSRRMRT